jgi:hypothetical protein
MPSGCSARPGARGEAPGTIVVDDIGFDPVDGGDLDNSWRQQTAVPSAPHLMKGVRGGREPARRDPPQPELDRK